MLILFLCVEFTNSIPIPCAIVSRTKNDGKEINAVGCRGWEMNKCIKCNQTDSLAVSDDVATFRPTRELISIKGSIKTQPDD